MQASPPAYQRHPSAPPPNEARPTPRRQLIANHGQQASLSCKQPAPIKSQADGDIASSPLATEVAPQVRNASVASLGSILPSHRKGYTRIADGPHGHISGFPHLSGQVIAANDFFYIIQTPSGALFEGHRHWFVVNKKQSASVAPSGKRSGKVKASKLTPDFSALLAQYT